MRTELERGTWLDDECHAYNTYSGRPHGSNRRCRALCADGKLRSFRAGVADTYFSIPVVGKVSGKYARGVVAIDDGALVFTQHGVKP